MMAPGAIVIVGAGQAGARCAETLRAEGFAGRVIVIGDEHEHPYERPPLSKALLGSDADVADARIHLHAPDSYRERGIELMLGRRVTQLSLERQAVQLDDGSRVPFDRCILATGGRARSWPGTILGDAQRIATLRTVLDARALRACLQSAARLVIIGGGFLGLECAGAAAQLGLDVTVLEAAPQLLGQKLPPALSAQLQQRYTERGVTLRCGAAVTRIEDFASSSAARIVLSGGEVLEADLCLIAIGQQPNDELAVAAGLETGNGIHVDRYCQTSAPHVFAAGDCASFPFGQPARRVRLESWQNAEQQSRVAARNALGAALPYELLPWFWTDLLGWNIQILGLHDGGVAPEWVVRSYPNVGAAERQVWFGLRDAQVVAAIAVNSGGDVQPLRMLIEKAALIPRDILLDCTVKLSKIARG